jgi:uncharacterized protein (TIGR03437 family)
MATPNAFQPFLGGFTDGVLALLTGIGPAPTTLATVCAASFSIGAPVAPGAIVSGFGQGLATSTESAITIPLPTMLAGATVLVRDTAGIERVAPLFYVSPTQINYIVPEYTKPGPATASVSLEGQVVASGPLDIANTAPGIFTANSDGQGPAAALAVHVAADGSQTYQFTTQEGCSPGTCVAVPIDLGPESEQVVLLLFGTGIRGRSELSAVNAKIDGVVAEVMYAGPQSEYVGFDQVNVLVPRSLAGRGEVNVVLTVEGKPSNTVRIHIQ